MNLKSVYNLKAWFHWLTGLSGILGILLGLVPQHLKLYAGLGSAYALVNGILAQLTKAGVAAALLVVLLIPARAQNPQNPWETPDHLAAMVYHLNAPAVKFNLPIFKAQQAPVQPLGDIGATLLARLNFKHLFQGESLTGAVVMPFYGIYDNQHGWTLVWKGFIGAQAKDAEKVIGSLLSLDWNPPHFGKFSGFVAIGPQLVQGKAVAGVAGVGFQYSTRR
jgi:hypothetical protein